MHLWTPAWENPHEIHMAQQVSMVKLSDDQKN